MKKSFKRAVAAVSAVSVIAFGGLSASAATKEDVIAAARWQAFWRFMFSSLVISLRLIISVPINMIL